MKSELDDLHDLKSHLKKELQAGNHFVAFNSSSHTNDPADYCCFEKAYDAWEYCYENSTDYDNYGYRSIRTCLKAIDYGLANAFSNGISKDPDANPLYQREGNSFTDLLIDYIESQQLQTVKINNMNTQNYEYLKDNLKYMGFGENLNEMLETNLKAGKSEFTLSSKTEVNKKPFVADLHFRKSDNTDMFFFNSYNASLERLNGVKVNQTFYLNKGKGVTAKEAYNLLEGRSVLKELNTKEGQSYKAWIQLDFDRKDKNNNNEVKQYHENYGFDLKAAVSKFPIQELKDPEKESALMQSLQKGNIQSINMEKGDNVSRMFVEANPQYKTVNLYDGQLKRMQKEALEQIQLPSQSQQPVGEQKQPEMKKDGKEEKKSLKNQPAKKDDSLLTKKRISPKKGLSMQ